MIGVRPGCAGEVVVAGPITVDTGKFEAYIMNRELDLTLSEFRVLLSLVKKHGYAMTRDVLLEDLSDGSRVVDRNIDVHIAALRKKMPECRSMIKTVRGVGYKLAVPGPRRLPREAFC